MAMDGTSIAGQVRRARKAAGLTQAALAALTGTTQSAVSRLESGRLVPTLAVLERVAAATGRPITVVVGPPARRTDPAATAPPPTRPAAAVAPRAARSRASAGRPLPSSARRAGT
jgi:transcriptional regulator with XRE-family HTH domain